MITRIKEQIRVYRTKPVRYIIRITNQKQPSFSPIYIAARYYHIKPLRLIRHIGYGGHERGWITYTKDITVTAQDLLTGKIKKLTQSKE